MRGTEESAMREFRRAPVVCRNCKARIYWGLSRLDVAHPDSVRAVGSEPPAVNENCPRCRSEVNTSAAYPAVAGFPAPFASLKEAYKGFAPRSEFNRASLEAAVHKVVRSQGIGDLERQLNEPDGLDWLRQR